MMVNLQAILPQARRQGYAVGSFNVYNYETIRGVIDACGELDTPVIVAFGAGYLPNMGVDEVGALVQAMAAKAKTPVALHLDHCRDFDTIVRALKAGFTSVMYDGSALPYEENIAATAQVVRLARAVGAGVEAELGALGGGEFSNEESGEEIYTDPSQARRFADETGVDALAVSIGTVHGMYKGAPRVDIGILKEIAAATAIPLVLHGGSGTPAGIIRECIRNGIAKINVNTEISVFTMERLTERLKDGRREHLSQLSLYEVDCVKEVARKYAAMFKTAG